MAILTHSLSNLPLPFKYYHKSSSSSSHSHRLHNICNNTTTNIQLGIHRIMPTTRSTKFPRAQIAPDSSKQLKNSLDMEKLQKAVKEFPLKKAGNLFLQRVVSVGEKALQVSLVTLFILNFCSDVLFSFARNKELFVPVGLLIGCFITDFLKEVFQELLHISPPQEIEFNWKVAGCISCFFIFTKLMSAVLLPLQGHVFVLNIANGGVMQTLWLWFRSSSQRKRIHSDDNGDDSQIVETMEYGDDSK